MRERKSAERRDVAGEAGESGEGEAEDWTEARGEEKGRAWGGSSSARLLSAVSSLRVSVAEQAAFDPHAAGVVGC